MKNNEEINKNLIKKYNKFLSVLLVIMIIFFVIQKLYCISFVSGNSMYPTFKNGQLIMVYDKNVSHLKHNNIILMKANPKKLFSEVYIKRIVGMPGDKVFISNENLYVMLLQNRLKMYYQLYQKIIMIILILQVT